MESADSILDSSLFVEGPYGEHAPLHHFPHLLLIAGGSGFSAIFAYLQDYVERRGHVSSSPTTIRTRSVRVIWTSRLASHIRDVTAKELQPLLGRGDVEASFYYTSAGADPQASLARSLDAEDVDQDKEMGGTI